MSQIRLDNLVAALASSVAEAEHSVRLNQIRNLRSFFDADNLPVSVEIQMPKIPDGSSEPGHDLVKVPLITLVNLSHMSISEMEIKFQTDLGDVSEPDDSKDGGPMSFAAEDPAESARQGLGWSERDKVAIDASTSPSTSESGRASVTLRVKQADTPEGLARIVARLNRLL
ncbi:MAG: DUF2589 domain-containing protein [Nannocystaceae bacterium]